MRHGALAGYAVYAWGDGIIKGLGGHLSIFEIGFFNILFASIFLYFLKPEGEQWYGFWRVPTGVRCSGSTGRAPASPQSRLCSSVTTTNSPDGCGCEPPPRQRVLHSGSSFRTLLRRRFEATLPPREDRDAAAPLFPGVSADRLRTAIARSCRPAGVPVFSPHDLRHRRISLLHRQGRTWAEISRLVGQRKLSVTADTYTHVLSDGRELDYPALVSELVRQR